MSKYFQIAKISFKQEMAYPLNFLMWRVRNVIQILVIYFLWSSAFSDPKRVLFGYDKDRMLTYVLSIMLVRAFVLSSKASDVAGEISRGELSNSLVKPFNYFKYWLSRDLAGKVLNVVFASAEIGIMIILFHPSVFFQKNFLYILLFVSSIILAIFLYTTLVFLVSTIAFWIPEGGWAAHFLLSVIIVEFLSGVLFPLDVLPDVFQKILNLMPFPYLVFFPISIYLGKVDFMQIIYGYSIGIFWLGLLFVLVKIVWKRGLKVYEVYGR